jgi:pimeloyl-ACP methyl ester carboxylesterase
VIAIGQGPVVALRRGAERHVGNGAVIDFLDGKPDDVPDRYDMSTPRLAAGPRMVAVVGSRDDVVPPEFSVDDDQPGAIEVVTIDGADHMVLIDPDSKAWGVVRALLDAAIRSRRPAG